MKRTLTYIIDEFTTGLTVEKYLKNKGFSSAGITFLKRMDNNVTVNKDWVHMKHVLSLGDTLAVNINEGSSSEKIVPIKMPLDIIYEDEDILVINKASDTPIHPSLNNYNNSLANGLAYYYEVEQNTPFVFRCTNRLDRNTSGLTIISKHFYSAGILSAAVRNREIQREYLAIVEGTLTQKEGTIDAPIARINDSIITRTVDFKKGEHAVTHYKVLREMNGLSLVSIHLETGRTHQIRVHFQYIGHPLIGDGLYNPSSKYEDYISRQALHSHKVSFRHPVTGAHMEFTADMPADMLSVCNR